LVPDPPAQVLAFLSAAAAADSPPLVISMSTGDLSHETGVRLCNATALRANGSFSFAQCWWEVWPSYSAEEQERFNIEAMRVRAVACH
jgi:hypothetical protein